MREIKFPRVFYPDRKLEDLEYIIHDVIDEIDFSLTLEEQDRLNKIKANKRSVG